MATENVEWLDEDEYPPLEDCPFFARMHELPGYDPKGVCNHGCWEEPRCMTGLLPTDEAQRLRDAALAFYATAAEGAE